MKPNISQIPFLILVGGLGTRLESLNLNQAKCLLEVQGRPFLFYLLKQIEKAGGKKVILLTGYKAEQFLKTSEVFKNLDITLSHEEIPLGTGGALLQALHFVQDEFFLLNGDSYFDIALSRLAQSGPGLALKKITPASDYGSVSFNENLIIKSFVEKKEASEAYINAGIAYLKKEYFSSFESKSCSLEKDLLPLIIKKHELKAFLSDNYFIDIGTPERLKKAQEDFKRHDFFS